MVKGVVKEKRYNNYHKHNHESNIRTLDCVVKAQDYMDRALELGHTTYFTVEHGWTGKYLENYDLCKTNGLKMIYGSELYAVKNRYESDNSNYHIVVVGKNQDAFYELNEIISKANSEGFYYKPRVDIELLTSLNPNNFIVTSACIAGILRNEEGENTFLEPLVKHFSKNFYFEVQNHNHVAQARHNHRMVVLSGHYGCQLIHANDSHYIYPAQQKDRNMFLKGKGMNYGDEDSFLLDYPDWDEIVDRYVNQSLLLDNQIEQALTNTLIFDECEDLYFDKEIKMPSIYPNEDKNKKLLQILVSKWKKERVGLSEEEQKKRMDGIKYEYEIIRDTNMADYFLFNEKKVDLAVNKYNGVLSRTGRGSAVSFYDNKLLGFTEIDRFDAEVPLYPTRFMSVARILESKSLPDIDMNWADVEAPIKASKELLGDDGVRYMYAIGKMKEGNAFRNVCRANDLPMHEYNEVAKNLDLYRNDKKWKPLIDEAQKYIDVIESISPSPCSFLLLDKPISRELGLVKVGEELCACIDGYMADVWKYLKNDELTVRVWKIISDTYKVLEQPIPNIKQLKKKLDDSVWELYEKGLTATLNQADTDVSTSMLKRYKPKSPGELSAFVAAIRPGFASLVNIFLDREEYSTGVDEIDEILKPSYHFMLYQESIMAFLVWCGMKEDHTYDIIKKIAKKKFSHKEQELLREELLQGYIGNTGSDDGFGAVWQVVEDAARYSFNASHSLSVAWDSLYGAELKAHYPLEYYTVVLNEYQNDTEKTGRIISELPHFNIKLESIKYGKSRSTYSFDRGAQTIYKSVSSIKYCNEQISEELFELSQSRDFDTFPELLTAIKTQTSVNSRQLLILTTLNFFSFYGRNKKLLRILKIHDVLFGKKQIKKSDLDKYGLQENLVRKYSLKETEKLYKEVNIDAIISEIIKPLENKSLSVKDQIQNELSYLEYITYTNQNLPTSLFYVEDFKVYSDKTKPYLLLYCLNNGTNIRTKITEGKKFGTNPFQKGNIIKVQKWKQKNKMKKINGSWNKTSQIEEIISEWEVY